MRIASGESGDALMVLALAKLGACPQVSAVHGTAANEASPEGQR